MKKKMKFRSQTCSICDGLGVADRFNIASGPCDSCDGERIEYILSPKQLALYQEVWKLAGKGKIVAAKKNIGKDYGEEKKERYFGEHISEVISAIKDIKKIGK